MVGAIEQPWRKWERDLSEMTGKVCRAIRKSTENMKARLRPPSDDDLKQKIDERQLVLDKLMIKRTSKSRTIDGDDVLVKLLVLRVLHLARYLGRLASAYTKYSCPCTHNPSTPDSD